MMRSGSSIAAFAAECVFREDGAEMTKEDMYTFYTDWCSTQDLPTETIKMLGTKLPNYVTFISEGLMWSGSSRVKGWRNAGVKTEKQGATFDDFK